MNGFSRRGFLIFGASAIAAPSMPLAAIETLVPSQEASGIASLYPSGVPPYVSLIQHGKGFLGDIDNILSCARTGNAHGLIHNLCSYESRRTLVSSEFPCHKRMAPPPLCVLKTNDAYLIDVFKTSRTSILDRIEPRPADLEKLKTLIDWIENQPLLQNVTDPLWQTRQASWSKGVFQDNLRIFDGFDWETFFQDELPLMDSHFLQRFGDVVAPDVHDMWEQLAGESYRNFYRMFRDTNAIENVAGETSVEEVEETEAFPSRIQSLRAFTSVAAPPNNLTVDQTKPTEQVVEHPRHLDDVGLAPLVPKLDVSQTPTAPAPP